MVIDSIRARRGCELFRAAADCRACPAMEGRRRVLSERNGSLNARLMLIAEAPGARGAERTGVPFGGDQSGRNFDRLLAMAGFNRNEVFITNAVICNPQTASGGNRRPTVAEVRSCSRWLQEIIELVDPPIIATLGAVALAALKQIQPHRLALKRDCALTHRWRDRWLVPLYHPSPRVMAAHRRFQQQREDWLALAAAVHLKSFCIRTPSHD